MFMVLIIHANYSALGWPRISHFTDTPITSFLQLLTFFLTVVGVNAFVLISGWFGIKSSFTGFLRLCFLLLVAWGSVVGGLRLLGENLPAEPAELFQSYYSLWFVVSYMILYILSPVLNSYLSAADTRSSGLLLCSFFAFQFVMYEVSDDINRGFSVLSFMGLYMLARYIRLHLFDRINRVRVWCFPAVFFGVSLGMTLLLAALAYNGQSLSFYETFNMVSAYASPNVVVASLALFLWFGRMHFSSSFINRLGASSLMVYATHQNLLIRPYYAEMVKWLHTELSTPCFVGALLLALCLIYGIATLLNEIAMFLWGQTCRLYGRVAGKWLKK